MKQPSCGITTEGQYHKKMTDDNNSKILKWNINTVYMVKIKSKHVKYDM